MRRLQNDVLRRRLSPKAGRLKSLLDGTFAGTKPGARARAHGVMCVGSAMFRRPSRSSSKERARVRIPMLRKMISRRLQEEDVGPKERAEG